MQGMIVEFTVWWYAHACLCCHVCWYYHRYGCVYVTGCVVIGRNELLNCVPELERVLLNSFALSLSLCSCHVLPSWDTLGWAACMERKRAREYMDYTHTGNLLGLVLLCR